MRCMQFACYFEAFAFVVIEFGADHHHRRFFLGHGGNNSSRIGYRFEHVKTLVPLQRGRQKLTVHTISIGSQYSDHLRNVR